MKSIRLRGRFHSYLWLVCEMIVIFFSITTQHCFDHRLISSNQLEQNILSLKLLKSSKLIAILKFYIHKHHRHFYET